jgi:hypothetical protein
MAVWLGSQQPIQPALWYVSGCHPGWPRQAVLPLKFTWIGSGLQPDGCWWDQPAAVSPSSTSVF